MSTDNSDDVLVTEVEYRGYIKTFFTGDDEEARENAGELLIYLSATPATASMLIDFQLFEVCETLLQLRSERTTERIVTISLCIINNMLSLQACKEYLLHRGSLYRALDGVLLDFVDSVVLMEALKTFLIVFSSNCIDIVAVTEETLGKLAILLNMIQTNSLCPELIARSWELAYYIAACQNSCHAEVFLIENWRVSSILTENMLQRVECLQEGIVDNVSGLGWVLKFVETVFSESSSAAISLFQSFKAEDLDLISVFVFQLASSEMTLSREEGLSLVTSIEAILVHFSEDEVGNNYVFLLM